MRLHSFSKSLKGLRGQGPVTGLNRSAYDKLVKKLVFFLQKRRGKEGLMWGEERREGAVSRCHLRGHVGRIQRSRMGLKGRRVPELIQG